MEHKGNKRLWRRDQSSIHSTILATLPRNSMVVGNGSTLQGYLEHAIGSTDDCVRDVTLKYKLRNKSLTTTVNFNSLACCVNRLKVKQNNVETLLLQNRSMAYLYFQGAQEMCKNAEDVLWYITKETGNARGLDTSTIFNANGALEHGREILPDTTSPEMLFSFKNSNIPFFDLLRLLFHHRLDWEFLSLSAGEVPLYINHTGDVLTAGDIELVDMELYLHVEHHQTGLEVIPHHIVQNQLRTIVYQSTPFDIAGPGTRSLDLSITNEFASVQDITAISFHFWNPNGVSAARANTFWSADVGGNAYISKIETFFNGSPIYLRLYDNQVQIDYRKQAFMLNHYQHRCITGHTPVAFWNSAPITGCMLDMSNLHDMLPDDTHTNSNSNNISGNLTVRIHNGLNPPPVDSYLVVILSYLSSVNIDSAKKITIINP